MRRRIRLLRRTAVTAVLASLMAVLAAVGGCAGGPRSSGAPAPSPAPRTPQDVGAGEGNTVITHAVRAGESLASIADNYYGDPGRAAAIAARNGLKGEPSPGSALRLVFAPAEWESAQRRAAALEPYNRGVQALAQDRLGEAERLFRQSVQAAPDLANARYNLALVLLRRGMADDAVALLRDLTRERPRDPEYACALGNALFQTAQFGEAASWFQEALALDPVHRRAAFGRARSLQEDGRRADAAAAWRRYLELDPDSSWSATARENLRKLADGR